MAAAFLASVVFLLILTHLVCSFADRRGWMVYRARTYSSRASSAFVALQATMQPRVVHIEEAARDKKQEQPNAGPDDPHVYWR